MTNTSFIHIQGANENNLKNISVSIPKGKLTVVTGLSGSGKSSLVFNVLYSEAQRRYIESLSTHSGYFIPAFHKAKVDKIAGLTPSISIAQNTTNYNPRSTVGTVTELYDYLRLLYAKIGIPQCPTHQTPVQGMSASQIVDLVFRQNKKDKLTLLVPVVQGKKGEFTQSLLKWAKQGFLKASIDGHMCSLTKPIKLSRYKRHFIDLFGDTFEVVPENKKRLLEAIEHSFSLAQGQVKLAFNGNVKKAMMYSQLYNCSQCDFSLSRLEPYIFSFNHPLGFCESCLGIGVIENKTCSVCEGQRLNETALNVFVQGCNISQLSQMPISQLQATLKSWKFDNFHKKIATEILKIIFSKTDYMKMTNTDYLCLDRALSSLSGGEAQRIRLTTQMGSALQGLTYVLDEPSIGLHPYNHDQLLGVIKKLCQKGNTVVVVEHDLETIRSADYLIDLGPGGGAHGGTLLLQDFVTNLSLKYLPKKEQKKGTSHSKNYLTTPTLNYLFNKQNIHPPEWRKKNRSTFDTHRSQKK